MDARGKFGEHEKCVRVARGAAESSSFSIALIEFLFKLDFYTRRHFGWCALIGHKRIIQCLMIKVAAVLREIQISLCLYSFLIFLLSQIFPRIFVTQEISHAV